MYALDAYTNMGTIQLYQRKFDFAAASFAKAIKADSGHLRTAALSHKLSYALEKLGKHSEALRVLQDDAGGAPGSFKKQVRGGFCGDASDHNCLLPLSEGAEEVVDVSTAFLLIVLGLLITLTQGSPLAPFISSVF